MYKRIENAIETVPDICTILNADLTLGIPESEEDITSSLVNNRIIDPLLGEEIQQMKRFHNIVVHRYGKIDDIVAFKILAEHLPAFEWFYDKIDVIVSEAHKV